jgi:succinate dehydrogenase / fumarate reductase, cytochrome b subunit
MSKNISFYKSSVGKKVVMALSGLVLVGFVLSHMLGNLKIFLGIDSRHDQYAIDIYSQHLREIGEAFFGHEGFLWLARAVLLGAVVVHATSAILLSKQNRQAKPIVAHGVKTRSANAASRTMLFGGLFLTCFIIFHILHLTTGHLHNSFIEGQVYKNIFEGFKNPLVAGFYVAAVAFLSLHLYHGAWSMFQTLGITSPIWNTKIRLIAKVLSVLLFFGFSSVPVAVSLGCLATPQAASVISTQVK